MLSEKRDMDAAKKFLTGAKYVAGRKPVRVTTDAHNSYPRAIRRILGRKVVHRTCRYLNNRLEQDHRSIKQRYYSRKVYAISGFGSFGAASRFCHAYMEVWCDLGRQYFRYRTKTNEKVSLPEQRRLFQERLAALQ
jgi:putative transposase